MSSVHSTVPAPQPFTDRAILVDLVVSDAHLHLELLQPRVSECDTPRKSLYRPLLVLDEIKEHPENENLPGVFSSSLPLTATLKKTQKFITLV